MAQGSLKRYTSPRFMAEKEADAARAIEKMEAEKARGASLLPRFKDKLQEMGLDEGTAQRIGSATAFVPIMGESVSADEARAAWEREEYGPAALHGLAAGVGVLPLAGDAGAIGLGAIARRIQQGLKGVKKPPVGAGLTQAAGAADGDEQLELEAWMRAMQR